MNGSSVVASYPGDHPLRMMVDTEAWNPILYCSSDEPWGDKSHFSDDGKTLYHLGIVIDRDQSLPVKLHPKEGYVVCISCNGAYQPSPHRLEEWRTGMCRHCFTTSRHRERVAARKKKQVIDGKVVEVGNEKRKRG